MLLEIDSLRVSFATARGEARAVDGVSLSVRAGETLCVVGESGCGKSVTALSIMGLVPSPPATLGGSIRFEGRELLGLNRTQWSDLRGNRIAMIFQEPMTSLNPAFTVGSQLTEALMRHRAMSRSQAREAAIAMLARVRIPSPERRIDDYPHRLSGGMRQRVMIAMALLCQPALHIADEPTTALDVTIQAQILHLLREVRRKHGTSIVFITHDLGVVAQLCDSVAVMYAGRVVEYNEIRELCRRPRHPYTAGLMQSNPVFGRRQERLHSMEGQPPDLVAPPAGCAFAARCPHVQPICREQTPPRVAIDERHFYACWRDAPPGAAHAA